MNATRKVKRCNRCHRTMTGTTAYDGACACGGLIEVAHLATSYTTKAKVNAEIEKSPITESALTGLPLVDVLDERARRAK